MFTEHLTNYIVVVYELEETKERHALKCWLSQGYWYSSCNSSTWEVGA